MQNPGYVHELAAIYLNGDHAEIRRLARRNGVNDSDLDAAIQTLKDLDPRRREIKIHDLYVLDAVEKGYAEGDPANETTWVLSQRAHGYYEPEGH